MSDIPNGWAEVAIVDVTKPFALTDPKGTPQKMYKYVDIGSIDNGSQSIANPKIIKGAEAPSRARRVIHTGDTLFSTVRTYLKNIAIVPAELDSQLTSTGIAVLRPNEAVDPRYLFMWTCSNKFVDEISLSQDGTMYPAVSDVDVTGALIRVPPLAEQRRIVAKIDSLSTKSRRARDQLDHIPRLVEKYKQAIVAAAFRGALTRQAGTHSDRAWDKISVDNLFEWSSGKNLPSKQQKVGNIPVIGGNGVSGYHNAALIDFPTLVIGRVGAQCGNVHRSDGPAWITDNAIYVKSISESIDLDFAALFFRASNLNSLAGGTGQPYVNQTTLNELMMPVPAVKEQREIVHRTNLAFAWIDRLASEASSARKLIDHLDQAVLAKAFRGELVPQDPNDEPASVLLERLRAERFDPGAMRRRGLGR